MKCLIIDDEPKAIDVLKDYVEKVPFLELAGAFRDSLEALDFIRHNRVDLIFLDINLPDLTGIQFLNALTVQPLIIFSTAYSEYALESYDYDAVDYLLKPIEFDRFLKAVHKASKQFRHSEESLEQETRNGHKKEVGTILLKSGTDYYQVKIDDILYIKSAGNYAIFITNENEIMTLMSMKNVMELLPQEHFVRIHKSYIAAFQHIGKIEKDQVKIDNKAIPVGETYKVNLQQFIQMYR